MRITKLLESSLHLEGVVTEVLKFLDSQANVPEPGGGTYEAADLHEKLKWSWYCLNDLLPMQECAACHGSGKKLDSQEPCGVCSVRTSFEEQLADQKANLDWILDQLHKRCEHGK